MDVQSTGDEMPSKGNETRRKREDKEIVYKTAVGVEEGAGNGGS